MIAERLSRGKANARTGKELAAIFGWNIRQVTKQIEIERRQGQPICAETTGQHKGYYLADSAEELERYCAAQKRRAIEIFKTRQHLIAVFKEIAAEEAKKADGKND